METAIYMLGLAICTLVFVMVSKNYGEVGRSDTQGRWHSSLQQPRPLT